MCVCEWVLRPFAVYSSSGSPDSRLPTRLAASAPIKYRAACCPEKPRSIPKPTPRFALKHTDTHKNKQSLITNVTVLTSQDNLVILILIKYNERAVISNILELYNSIHRI